jgi:hypothetical protein
MKDTSMWGAGLVERFFAKVKQGADPMDCWEWTGGKVAKGYGMIRDEDQRMTNAHRVSWEIFHNEKLPNGSSWHVDHLCANPSCSNPLHLELVPNGVNVHRGSEPHFPEVTA